MSRKPSIEPVLITHVTVAALCSIDTETLREWVAKGVFPEPHTVFEHTWLYKRRVVQHFLDHGDWPKGTKFKPGVGRGRVPV